MIAAAIKSSIAVVDGSVDKADERVRELQKGTKRLLQGAQGQSAI